MKIRHSNGAKLPPPEYAERHEDSSEENENAVDDNISLGNEDGSDDIIDDDNDEYNDFFIETDDECDDNLFTANVDFDSEWCRENNGSKYDPNFELGMMFSNKKELRDAIHSHAIKNRRSINITKNDKIRVYAKCAAEECEWKLHALKISEECTFQIRKYVAKHTCVLNLYVKNLKSTWLSTKYMSKIRSDPKRNMKGFRTDVMEDIRCIVSKSQIYRAKAKATHLVEGQACEQYALIWDFANEVKRSNPGSTVVIGTNNETDENRFDMLYMCLYASKVGFLSGCRRFIGVDGCHLKGPHGGVLLSAVGIDPNNSNFPIALAVVNNESCETWAGF
ncbi:uncharacterized protein LOC142526151 [Primulina tabacum]|uniref:uncharacterized protein LOC142526151 n=1 Tax=Primulina tabacum TaxID=48773 RepID=UPI003F5A51A1